MYHEMHCEGFQPTEALKDFTQTEVEELLRKVPDKLNLAIFCRQEGPHIFSCVFRASIWKKEIVIRETGADLYALLHAGRKNLEIQVHKIKEKRLNRLRKPNLEEFQSGTQH
ncbi:MAG: HPF/RaiA family ribosome-associated protein [Bdellovibrionia bacterium]